MSHPHLPPEPWPQPPEHLIPTSQDDFEKRMGVLWCVRCVAGRCGLRSTAGKKTSNPARSSGWATMSDIDLDAVRAAVDAVHDAQFQHRRMTGFDAPGSDIVRAVFAALRSAGFHVLAEGTVPPWMARSWVTLVQDEDGTTYRDDGTWDESLPRVVLYRMKELPLIRKGR